MNLTVQQLAKATGLALPTVYAYSSRLKLGKTVNGKKVYSKADVQTILTKARKSPLTRGAKPSTKKLSKTISKRPIKKTAKAEEVRVEKPKPLISTPSPVVAKAVKPSFWSRVFRGRKDGKKVSLMDVKTRR